MALKDQIEEGARFAPTFKPTGIGDGLKGKVLAISERQARSYDDDSLLFDKNGKPRMEVAVTIASHYRNWEKVAKVPKDQETQQELPASEDVGERNIYMKDSNRTELQKAIVAAIPDAEGIEDIVGGVLAAKYDKDINVGKKSPMKGWAFQAEAPKGASLASQIEDEAPAEAAEAPAPAGDTSPPF